MRSKYFLFVVTIAMLLGITASGCDSTSNVAGGGGTGTTDQNIVGVWFTLSDTTGFDIKADGSAIPLSVDNAGKIVTAATAGITYKITTSGANITVSVSGKSSATGNDTTLVVGAGTYALSNNNNTLTITVTDNGQTMNIVYFKTSIGANAFTGGGGGGGTNTFSFVVDGITMNGTVVNPRVTNGFFSATSVESGVSLNITVQASTGIKNVSASNAMGFLSISSTSYSATGGSINVTSFSASNIKGTIDFTMTQTGGTATKTVTGSFDINY